MNKKKLKIALYWIWTLIGAIIVTEMIISLIWIRMSHNFDFIVPGIFFSFGIYAFMIYIAISILILIISFIIKHIIKR